MVQLLEGAEYVVVYLGCLSVWVCLSSICAPDQAGIISIFNGHSAF